MQSNYPPLPILPPRIFAEVPMKVKSYSYEIHIKQTTAITHRQRCTFGPTTAEKRLAPWWLVHSMRCLPPSEPRKMSCTSRNTCTRVKWWIICLTCKCKALCYSCHTAVVRASLTVRRGLLMIMLVSLHRTVSSKFKIFCQRMQMSKTLLF